MESINRAWFREVMDLVEHMLTKGETEIEIPGYTTETVIVKLNGTTIRMECGEYKNKFIVKRSGKEATIYLEKSFLWRLWDIDMYRFNALFKRVYSLPLSVIKRRKQAEFDDIVSDIRNDKASKEFEKEVLKDESSRVSKIRAPKKS